MDRSLGFPIVAAVLGRLKAARRSARRLAALGGGQQPHGC